MSLFAPGQGIEAPLYETVSNYLKATGTSMSAPHVAGAFAVVRQAVPGVSVDTALANFQATGAPVNNGGLGVRRIAVKAALDGLGAALGYGVVLCTIAVIREPIGTGTLLGRPVLPEAIPPARLIAMAPGAFLAMGVGVWVVRGLWPPVEPGAATAR